MKQLTIIGAGGHGRVIADIAKKMGYTAICFLDDNPSIQQCSGYPVIGTTADAATLAGDFFVAIGNAKTREKLMLQLKEWDKNLPVLIHPAAVIAPEVAIGCGTAVMAGAVINPGARIGEGCIINTTASVDHDCRLADYVHISVGAHLSGAVTVGAKTWIGIGAVVSNNISIIDDCVIGAGAVVIKDICEHGTYIGVPAKKADRRTRQN